MTATIDDLAPLTLPQIERGEHGVASERFRQEALHHLQRVSFCLAMMDHVIRMLPADVAMYVEWSEAAGRAELEFNTASIKFWQTRDVAGEA